MIALMKEWIAGYIKAQKAAHDSIPVDAVAELIGKLRAALKEDHALAASLYPRVLKAVARRLRATRLQLLDLFAR